MTRKLLMALTVSAGALAWAAPAPAQTNPVTTRQLTATDQQFLKEASAGNEAEVQLGQMASQKARHEEVKEFGRWMASAHGTAERELTGMMEHLHGVAPGATLTPEQTAMRQKLEGLSGDAFDRQYLQDMVQAHQQDIPNYEREARNGDDLALKTYAQNMLPALHEHLTEAEDLDRNLFNRTAAGAGTAAGTTGSTAGVGAMGK